MRTRLLPSTDLLACTIIVNVVVICVVKVIQKEPANIEKNSVRVVQLVTQRI